MGLVVCMSLRDGIDQVNHIFIIRRFVGAVVTKISLIFPFYTLVLELVYKFGDI